MQGRNDQRIRLALLRFLEERWAIVVSLIAWPILMLLCCERHVASDDPGNFVLAIRYGFDLAQMRPHAPGYPGFYVLWLFLRSLTGFSEFNVLLLSNLLFTCSAILLLHWVARQLFDRSVANIATLLLATNPLLLYFANTGELYAYDALFSAFAITLFVLRPKRIEGLLFFLYSLAGAFRLSSVMLTAPIAMIVLWREYRAEQTPRRSLINLFSIALGMFTWLVPLLVMLHGTAPLKELFGRASSPAEHFIPNLSAWMTSMFWMLNVCMILILLCAQRIMTLVRSEKYRTILLLIVIPSLYFALRVNAKGYTMLCLSPLMLLAAVAISKMATKTLVLATALTANLAIFFFLPFFRPPEIIARNYRHRSKSERLQWTVYRAVSFFAPTLAHLRINDEGNLGAKAMLSALPREASIYFDEASVLWAFPRSLQGDYPAMTFYRLHSGDAEHAFARYQGAEYIEDVPMPSTSPVYYLTTSTLSQVVEPPGTFVTRASNLALYEVLNDSIVRTYIKRSLSE